MPTPTYDLIASNVLSSSASSVTFSSIPATYRDLVLVFDGSSGGNEALPIYFNSDTGANYGRVFMYGTGSAAVSAADGSSTGPGVIETSTTRAWAVVQIMDYSATDKHKTTLSRSNTSGLVLAQCGRWASTSAITSITIDPLTGNLNSGSTFYLYGIVS